MARMRSGLKPSSWICRASISAAMPSSLQSISSRSYPSLIRGSLCKRGRAAHDRSLRHDHPVRVLTAPELNRALLARQSLLGRSAEPLPRVLEAVAGIQAQYAPSMYVWLWSRTAGLARGAVTGALEDRSAVQAWMMRVTIHLVSREDFWPIALAVRDA